MRRWKSCVSIALFGKHRHFPHLSTGASPCPCDRRKEESRGKHARNQYAECKTVRCQSHRKQAPETAGNFRRHTGNTHESPQAHQRSYGGIAEYQSANGQHTSQFHSPIAFAAAGHCNLHSAAPSAGVQRRHDCQSRHSPTADSRTYRLQNPAAHSVLRRSPNV